MKKIRPVTISIPTENIDKNKQKQSFMPNLIHSLDAAHLHFTLSVTEVKNVYTIHDCFASDLSEIDILNKEVLFQFIKMYFDINYLDELDNSLNRQISSFYDILYDNTGKYILLKNKKCYIPNLPDPPIGGS